MLVREDLDALLHGGAEPGTNIVSELVDTVTRLVLQQLLEAEQADYLGGRGRYERRGAGQSGSRNGYEPALLGKVRCALREESMSASLERPEVLSPPEHPPTCCTQQTVTVPVTINAKTAQRHDYPSAAWRRSYARRSGAERPNSKIKDPATVDVTRGWCR